MNREQVDNIISFLMKRKGIKSKSDLASRINIHPSTLSTAIKDISEGRIDDRYDIINKLAGELEVTPDDIIEPIKKGKLPDLDAHAQVVRETLSEYKEINKGYVSDILDLTRKLGQDDVYTLVTCHDPLEYDDEELMRNIVRAINNGAKFRYVFPDENLRGNKHMKLHMTRHTRGCFSLKNMFQEYADELEKHGLSANKVRKKVEMRTSSDLVLMSPYNKYIHLTRRLIGTENTTVFSEIRIGESDSTEIIKYWYPLPRYDAQAISEAISRTFK